MTVPVAAAVAVKPPPARPRPRPGRAAQPSWEDLEELESNPAMLDSDPPPQRLTALPVARRTSSIPDWQLGAPYTSLPGEELVDAFLPLVMVGLFLVSAGLDWYAGMRTFDTFMQQQEANSHIPADVKARATGYLYGRLAGMTVLPPLLFAGLAMLATLVSSKILKFTPRAGSYARCIIIGITPSSVSFALQRLLGDDMAAPPLTFIVASIATAAVMWLLTRYRLMHFVVTAGITLSLMLVAVFGLIGISRMSPTNMQPQPIAQSPVYPPRQQAFQLAPSVPMANASGNPAVTQNNLREIYQALLRYCGNHPRGPARLEDIPAEMYPSGAAPVPPDARLHYTYRGYDPTNPQGTVVAYEAGDRSIHNGTYLLMQDGTVRFYPGNTADPILRSSPINPFTARSTQPPPTRQPRETPAPADSPDAQLLSKVADGDKAYFARYGKYPVGLPDLVREGSLTMQDSQSSPNHHLSMQAFIPSNNDLPAEILVAYVYDSSTHTYTALFGDWSIKTVSDDDWSLVRFRSSQTRRNMAKPVSP